MAAHQRPETRIRIGGLLRCCTFSLEETDRSGELPTEPGEGVDCNYCKNPMRLADDGVWEWDRDECFRRDGRDPPPSRRFDVV